MSEILERAGTDQDVVDENDVMIPMRDGVRLRADIYRPAGPGPFPVLVHRWPYSSTMADMPPMCRSLARRGYVVMLQSVRGRCGSEGDFFPTGPDDIDDGYDTIEWAAAQPWSNGKVAMYGASYSGFTQWTAAMSRPPHLVAISPVSSSWNYFNSAPWYFAPGVMSVVMDMGWSAGLMYDTMSAPVGPEDLAEPNQSPPIDWDHRPMRDVEVAPWWKDWCDHDDPADPFWRRASAADHYEKIEVPVFLRVGWYDLFTKGTLDAFTTLRKFGSTEAVRKGTRLIVGPWTHIFPFPRPDLPEDVEPIYEDYDGDAAVLRFFDHHVNGGNPGYADEAPVRLFIMGDNIWRDEWEWPLARTEWTPFHLHSGGGANTVNGDGELSVEPPTAEPADIFTYDPTNPVTATPGPNSQGSVAIIDLSDVQVRPDVLVYATPPLESDVEVTGPVSLELWASSSAVDTDFTAKLVDVFPDGTAVPLCQGIVRARVAAGGAITPGVIYRYEIDLWATGNVFKAGHRIRLDISSSEWPTYELNPNTGTRITHDASGTTVPAVQHIFHDEQHPSRLTLPIIPR